MVGTNYLKLEKGHPISIYLQEKNVIENTDKIQVYSLKSNIAGNIKNVILKDIDYLIAINKVGFDLNNLNQNKNEWNVFVFIKRSRNFDF